MNLLIGGLLFLYAVILEAMRGFAHIACAPDRAPRCSSMFIVVPDIRRLANNAVDSLRAEMGRCLTRELQGYV
jgi:hypothetical protein